MKAKQIDLAQGKILIGDSSSRGSASAYTLPAADGSANQILETDGAGAVSWVTPSSGGSSGESVYIFPEVSGGLGTSRVFTGVGNFMNQWGNVTLTGFTTIYVVVNSSGTNWGDIIVPYPVAQGGNTYGTPPSNITRMIIKRKNGGNLRTVRVEGGYTFQINGVNKGTSHLTGLKLGEYGENLIFERNAADISNNNWRVYQL